MGSRCRGGMAWVLQQHTDAPASQVLHQAGFWCLYFIHNSQLPQNQVLNLLQPGTACPYAQLRGHRQELLPKIVWVTSLSAATASINFPKQFGCDSPFLKSRNYIFLSKIMSFTEKSLSLLTARCILFKENNIPCNLSLK